MADADEQQQASNVMSSASATSRRDLPDISDGTTDLPSFTKEQEHAELATLTVDEIADVEKDLRGITAGIGRMGLETSRGGRTEHGTSDSAGAAAVAATCVVSDVDLALLEGELVNLPSSEKVAYTKACSVCPQLLTSEHKAAFLEREGLDACLAAKRLVSYWEVRLETFGPDRCFLPMTLSGAIQDEISGIIQYSMYQLLPRTDLSGRAILFLDYGRRDFEKFSADREARVMFYLIDTLTIDPAIRRAGFVILATARNAERKNSSSELQNFFRNLIGNAMPIRMCAYHLCHPSKVYYYVIYPVLKHFMSRELRLRGRVHYGRDSSQLMDELEEYGLPRARLPVEIGGELPLDLEQWIADRSVEESMQMVLASERQQQNKDIEARATTTPSSLPLSSLAAPSLPPILNYIKEECPSPTPATKRHRSGAGTEESQALSSGGNTSLNIIMKAAGSSTAPNQLGPSAEMTEDCLNACTEEALETTEDARRKVIDSFTADLFRNASRPDTARSLAATTATTTTTTTTTITTTTTKIVQGSEFFQAAGMAGKNDVYTPSPFTVGGSGLVGSGPGSLFRGNGQGVSADDNQVVKPSLNGDQMVEPFGQVSSRDAAAESFERKFSGVVAESFGKKSSSGGDYSFGSMSLPDDDIIDDIDDIFH